MNKRITTALMCLCLFVFTLVFAPSVLGATNSYDATANYAGKITVGGISVNVCDGIVDRKDTATVTTYGNAKLVTPNPTSSANRAITLDHYSIKELNLSITHLKYIQIFCYYDGSTDFDTPYINILGRNKLCLTQNVEVRPHEKLVKGTWQWLTFDVGSAIYGKVSGDTLYQFHLYPYGQTKCSELTALDTVKISQIRFVSALNASTCGIVGKYPMSFNSSSPVVTGKDPETVMVSVGDSFTLPENPYTKEGFEFVGWICSADNKIYQPGDSYTVNERMRVNENPVKHLYGLTGEAIFFPDWKQTEADKEYLPDVYSVAYTDFHSAFLYADNNNKVDYFNPTFSYIFQGRRTLKLEVLTNSTEVLNLDGWNWNKMPFDLDKYKYATVTYYCDTEKTFDATPRMRLLKGDETALNGIYNVSSDYKLETGKWAVMGFDLEGAKDFFIPDAESHIVKQIHLQLTGHYSNSPNKITAADFNDGDVFYIDALTLYTEKPEGELKVFQQLIKGDGDGNVRPHDNITRAEAAQLVYNTILNEGGTEMPSSPAASFSDVVSTDWFYPAVAALDTLGIIPKDECFRPYDNTTLSEFLLFMTNAGLGGSDSPTFTLGEGSTKAITRAEAAIIVSDFLTNEIPEQLKDYYVYMFDDLDVNSLEYMPIMNIASARLSSFDKDGKETIHQFLCPGSSAKSLEYTTGEAYRKIKELDKLEAKRIEEIRSTESVYKLKSEKDNRIYYLSSSEGTASGGNSPDNPKLITSLSQVTSLYLKNGDVVLFKRGDVFRGYFTAAAGVTYSAYGEGEKPILYRSEKNHTGSENWVLVDNNEGDPEEKKIWRTAATVSNDVGAIIIDEGKIVGLKEIPDFKDGTYFVRGTGQTVVFDTVAELNVNHEFFHDVAGNYNGSGYVYFRCDEGNPGELYDSIEMNQRQNLITVRSNVTIDNLCLKYFGSHGIGVGTASNLTVTNCEIGWGGGSVQNFNNNKTTRYGNGIEIYGGLTNYIIDNCYVYEIYDAGITHQISTHTKGNFYMENVRYTNNVLCDSCYNIEYFMSKDEANFNNERFMKDVLFEGNLVRRAGYGWGVQRPDSKYAAIKGWVHHNNAVNYVIKNNVFDRAANRPKEISYLIEVGSTYVGACPYFEGNTIIQVPGRGFSYHHGKYTRYDYGVPNLLEKMGGKDNVVYYAPEDFGKK